MGCVGFSRRFFPEGRITRQGFREAELAAWLELQPFASSLSRRGWDTAVGTSGTIGAAAELMEKSGQGQGPLTLAGLKALRRALVGAGDVERALPGLKPDRVRVLPGGLAILITLFRALGLDALAVSASALREGVLYDLVGRIRHEDVRDRTIRRLVGQYHVDVAQAARVERTALALFDAVVDAWWPGGPPDPKPLAWACRLHEIGLAVSFAGFHRHGAYLVAHSDMPGFSEDDQQLLAALIGGQRRKLSPALFDRLAPAHADDARRLCVILRLATLLNRSRSAEAAPRVTLDGDAARLALHFPPRWLAEHPLTAADLRAEAAQLERDLGLALDFTGGLREAAAVPPGA
jgi:exopolyphosphatase/guanosine-5'-triphosphate,3'-diphosphate pyrophosphatase